MRGVYNRGTPERPRWYCNYVDLDGRRKHRRLSGTSREEALEELRALLARVAAGRVAMERSRAKDTAVAAEGSLRQLTERFLAEAPLRSKAPEKYRNMLRWLLGRHVFPELGDQLVHRLRPSDFDALSERMHAAGYKERTINAVLRACSVVFSWGRRRGVFGGPNPVSGLQRPVPDQDARYLNEEEVARLLAEAQRRSPLLWTVLRTALFTGLRKGELFGLRWSDVDLARGVLYVRRSYHQTPKSGRSRVVPLHPELSSILQLHRAQPASSELVFPVRNAMARPQEMLELHVTLRAAGVDAGDRPWHAMRHTFASHFAMNGGNLLALQRILGHSRFEMTQIYSHLSPGFLSQEILRIPFTAKPRT